MIRAKLEVTDNDSGRKTAAQILIKGLRQGNVGRLLYQVLWPSTHKAEALYIEKSTNGAITGFLFEPPDKVTPLTPSLLDHPYLDSDLSIEDLAEDFWEWPSREIRGQEAAHGELCRIREFRPPAVLKTSYSLIRTWVSIKKEVPLRVEKFGPDAHLAKWFIVEKVIRRNNNWVPLITVIQRAGKMQKTTLEISRGSEHIEIPLADFSLENIKKFGRSTAKSPPD